MTFDPVDGRIILGFNGNDVDTRIVSYAVGDDGRPGPSSAREVLRIDKPGVGHNSGHLTFDAGNNLFISMGDGGGSRGADAQDMTKLLGGILRITPNRGGPGYTVPADNPYVGVPGVAPEIWAKGMRNPWRFSIDRATGDMWIGNVGESSWEAVYKIPAGQRVSTWAGRPTKARTRRTSTTTCRLPQTPSCPCTSIRTTSARR
ncbi:MAG: PQQ-dependent sugar dehydrogenase [Candidatus Limnocylindrales bacterium]